MTRSVVERKYLRTAIVVCGILRNEIGVVLRQQGIEAALFSLAPAPCIDYAVLGRQLERTLRRAAAIADEILVVIGRCHPDIDRITARYGARRLDVNDCFEALLSRDERHRLDREMNTFYTLPSWLSHWRRAFAKGMRWDEADARRNFGHYQRILLLDTGLRAVPPEQILEFFDYAGVPVETVPVTLDNLRRLIREGLDASPVVTAPSLVGKLCAVTIRGGTEVGHRVEGRTTEDATATASRDNVVGLAPKSGELTTGKDATKGGRSLGVRGRIVRQQHE